jgi:hypothetical protein
MNREHLMGAYSKLTVVYDPFDGDVVTDGHVQHYVNKVIDDLRYENVLINVGSELIVEHLRLAIGEGKIAHDRAVFIFNDQEIKFGCAGSMVQPSRWPEGFCDNGMKIISAICKLKTAKS